MIGPQEVHRTSLVITQGSLIPATAAPTPWVRATVRQTAAAVIEGDTAMTTTKDIRESVKAELSFDPLVDESSITVKNMNGDVALNGTVPT